MTAKEGIQLVARQVLTSGADPLGPQQLIGPLSQAGGGMDGTPHIRGCRSADTIAACVEGYRDEFVTFLSGGRFTPPVVAPGRGGDFSCRKTEATLTQVGPLSAFQVRCTAAGCQEASVKTEDLFGKETDLAPREGLVAGADLEGKLLVIWAAGERGGLRMRLAPVEQISKTPDVVLFDDLTQAGKAQKLSTLVEMRLLARGHYAVLLLNVSSGVHALRIDTSGKVAPIQVLWQK